MANGSAAATLAAAPMWQPLRFHIVPDSVRWQKKLIQLRVGAANCLPWRHTEQLPPPPTERPPHSVWLLPSTDAAALAIARDRRKLVAAGWKILTCAEEVIARLSGKKTLRALAVERGVEEYLPKHYDSLHDATYPCILKAETGEYGRNVFIVNSFEEAEGRTRSDA